MNVGVVVTCRHVVVRVSGIRQGAMVWKIISRRLRIENAHLQKSPRVEISMRFFAGIGAMRGKKISDHVADRDADRDRVC